MSFPAWLAQILRPAQSSLDRRVRLAQYNTYDARTLFSELLERVRTGEQIVIARAGRPIAKLVPYADEALRPGLYRMQLSVDDVRALPDEPRNVEPPTPTRSSPAASR